MSEQKLQANPRGIPQSPFVERVEDYVSEAEPVEVVLKKFQEAISKYKFMEVNLLQRKKLTRCLDSEKTIVKQQEVFAIGNDMIYIYLNDDFIGHAKAKVEDSDSVHKWLRAYTARVYNWDVKQRRLNKEKEGAASSS
ncbi:hypothetical protein K501DRAFT_293047 [Backusella circina FSU 941]|nr:hypothetical protein K501DRAFT_293047 [Backusella circina FSU 941]